MEPIKDINHIPVSIMQRAFEDTGLSLTRASMLCGWGKDAKKLRRILGRESDKRREARTTVDYEDAAHMVTSWGLDPVDYGV